MKILASGIVVGVGLTLKNRKGIKKKDLESDDCELIAL